MLFRSYNVVTCRDFALRAKALNEEAKRSFYPSDVHQIQDCVLMMHAAFKEAKTQGDPSDLEIARKKYKERRKVSMVTGMW